MGGKKHPPPIICKTGRYLHKLGLHAKNETSKSKDKKVPPPLNLKHVNRNIPFSLNWGTVIEILLLQSRTPFLSFFFFCPFFSSFTPQNMNYIHELYLIKYLSRSGFEVKKWILLNSNWPTWQSFKAFSSFLFVLWTLQSTNQKGAYNATGRILCNITNLNYFLPVSSVKLFNFHESWWPIDLD